MIVSQQVIDILKKVDRIERDMQKQDRLSKEAELSQSPERQESQPEEL